MARKTKLTPAVQERICKAISDGNYHHVAAAHAGIGESTFYRWLEAGEAATSGAMREFWESVKKAEAGAEVRYVAIIERATNTTWQAAAWWLERKHSDRWGKKEKYDVKGEMGRPLDIRVVYDDAPELSD